MIPNRFFTILFMAILLSCSGSEPANGTGTGIGSIDSLQGGQTEEGGDTGEGGDGPLVENREGAVTLDGAATIRTFEGLGALASYGKLLYDYPEPQRSQILDYLFLPNFGANLQILKVEMGSDGNNTAMAWPSHRRTLEEANDFTRGWSWWYMKEAVKRNPDMILSALNWGWPAWATTDELKSDFIADYVEGAWNVHGLRIRYIGGNQNESDITPAMTKLLRRKLNERGFGDVKIICADEGAKKARYQVLDYLSTDEEYCNVVDVIGVHYKSREADFMPEVTYSFGKPLWSTEDGGGGYGSAGQGNAWTAQLMKLFIDVKMSAAIRWLVTSSIYDNMPWPGNGIMKTKEPWSGHYIVGANLWSFAHFTQFIKPGWKQLKQDETYLIPETKKGRFIAYRAPVSGDYAIVVDAHDNTLPAEGTDFTWRLTGGLSTGTVYVWKSNFVAGGDWFVKDGTLLPDKDGYVTMKVMPETVYTISTVSTARKGSYESPAATPFPFPYTEDFEGYENASTVRYFVDAESIFEVAPATGREGKVLRQAIRQAPQMWHPNSAHPFQPVTEVGDMGWKNYRVQVDALLENSGKVLLGGRIDAKTESTADHDMEGYWFSIDQTGVWQLRRRDKGSLTVLATGRQAGFGTGVWTTLALEFSGSGIKAFVGDKQVASVTDATWSAGNVILGTLYSSVSELHKYTETWTNAQFDNLSVTALP